MEPVEEKARPSLKEWALDKGRTTWADVAKWKKVMLAVSAGMIVLGLLVALFEPGGAQDPLVTRPGAQGPGSTALGPEGTALVPGGVPSPAVDPEASNPGWSPAFLKMGFGFFVGFAVGFTLRTFLKLAVFAFGLLFLALFAMSSAELITVEWERIGDVFGGWFERVGEQMKGLQTLITGALPATGLGTFGLYAGLRKR